MRNLVLDVIKSQQVELRSEFEHAIDQLNKSAARTFALAMEFKQKEVNALIGALNLSKDITWIESDHDFVHRWVRFDFSQLIDTKNDMERELLTEYLSDNHYIECDFKNEVASTCEGYCLVINEDGDVLDQDSGKWVISKRDYESKQELFQLIEAYMERTSCYPSVIRSDRYGNVSYVNTQNQGSEVTAK